MVTTLGYEEGLRVLRERGRGLREVVGITKIDGDVLPRTSVVAPECWGRGRKVQHRSTAFSELPRYSFCNVPHRCTAVK